MKQILAFVTIFLIVEGIPITAQVDVSGVIINEIYYDVSANNNGNWNGGASSMSEDQFIELYNNSDNDVIISDWVICDANTFYFKFQSDTLILPARRSLVLAKVVGSHTPPPGHLALTVASAGFLTGTWEFSTSGDCIFLINPGPDHGVGGVDPDDEWLTFSYENAPEEGVTFIGRTPNGVKKGHESDDKDCIGQSINRNPDITGTSWEKHLVLNATSACSPNRKVDNSSPLPVEFLSFRAEVDPDEQRIILSWTSNEYNSAGYSIERRGAYETEWHNRGFQPSLCNTRCVGDYRFVDPYEKGSTRLLYRLHQFDVDGNDAFSPTISVELARDINLRIMNYPNPFGAKARSGASGGSRTTIVFDIPDFETGPVVLAEVYDQQGRFVKTLYRGSARQPALFLPFDADGLPSGTYYCRVVIGTRSFLRPLNHVR